jgi:hypothetical protein
MAKYRGRRLPKGFMLMEALFVIVISAMVLAGYAQYRDREIQSTAKSSYASQLKEIHAATQAYMAQNYAALIAGNPVTGFAAPMTPTVADLVNANILRGGNAQGFMGGQIAIELARVPAGCVAPACDIQSIVRGSQPILISGTNNPDMTLANKVAAEVGADGAVSDPNSPTVFTGRNGAWTVPNPTGVAGVVAVRGGYNSSQWAQYCPKSGCTFSGDINMGGNNITNVANLGANNGTFNSLNAGAGSFNTINSQTITNSGAISSASVNAANFAGGTFSGHHTGTANLSGSFSGSFVGNLTGNADTATYATTAGNANTATTAITANTANYSTSTGGVHCSNVSGASYAVCSGPAPVVTPPAGPSKPYTTTIMCGIGNNSVNTCFKDVWSDLNLGGYGISRSQVYLVNYTITFQNNNGCGADDWQACGGSLGVSNGMIYLTVNSYDIQASVTVSW